MAPRLPPHALSRVGAGLRVGADFFERTGLARAEPEVHGLVDRLADLAHEGFPEHACARVHPAIRRFFERTDELDLSIETTWHGLARPLFRLARPFMRRLGQLVLPLHTARIRTRVVAIDRDEDGRADARGVVRAYEPSGEPMQVLSYATAQVGRARYMTCALPLPLGNLAGLLRLDAPGAPDEGRIDAVTLTSRGADPAHAGGIWFVSSGRRLIAPLPFAEALTFWARDAAPAELLAGAPPGCSVLGLHEQRLLGLRAATHVYRFWPRGSA